MTYLYPKDLKATAKLWLWSLRDCGLLCMALVLSVVMLVYLHSVLPMAMTLCYAFLTIRLEDTTVLDFLRWAVRYFLTTQQTYFWR